MPHKTVLSAILAAVLAPGAVAQEVAPPLIITSDTKLPGGVLRRPVVIKASGITVDGAGTVLQGPGKPGTPATFAGTGISAEGCRDVVLKDVSARGWRRGLHLDGCSGFRIEGVDVSANWHDPSHGWGDGERAGGMILDRTSRCTILRSKGRDNWNGLDLRHSDANRVEDCDFSHCSNVCLKLETSCGNVIRKCDLSWGLRISPGEVHARDSTCVLIESGSDRNRLEDNDITHGGDGIFIRVLNAWPSTGNVFTGNDCSWANNNGIESWSPGNTWIGNKANHCSYGFWLGGSDHTVLRDNEAGWNGLETGFHNAPEPDFQHGGIVIVHGSGTHTLIDGNHCHDNRGGGIVFRGDLASRGLKWRMSHLIVQRNRIERNRVGIFGRFTDGLVLAANTFEGNEKPVHFEDVTDLLELKEEAGGPDGPVARLTGLSRVPAGTPVRFDGAGSLSLRPGRPLRYAWTIGAGDWSRTVARGTASAIEHTFEKPGFYRVGLTVDDGALASLSWVDVYATGKEDESATEHGIGNWMASGGGDPGDRLKADISEDLAALVGSHAMRARIDPYHGGEVSFRLPLPPRPERGRRALAFWLRFRNENIGGFQGPNPIVRLHAGKAAWTYLPCSGSAPRNCLMDLPYSEAREGWLRLEIPLEGSADWRRFETFDGAVPPHDDHGLRFATVKTPVETQDSSAMASDGTSLWCASVEGDRLFRSADGTAWERAPGPREALGRPGGGWMTGCLAFDAGRGTKGSLLIRHLAPGADGAKAAPRLAAFDIAAAKWSLLPTAISITHGAAVAGRRLFGLAHARGGDYGGALCRVDLRNLPRREDRTVPAIAAGADPGWIGRAAQLATLGDRVYGIKNDWKTPQPDGADAIGDRLFAFDPAAFRPSAPAGDDPDKPGSWKAEATPVEDLGPLPFEVGHGASLVALPPRWGPGVGLRGGLFVVAGCSPSDHEGAGPPSRHWALYDVAAKAFTTGTLPAETGTGTSAAFHAGKLFVKRGGTNFGPTNGELWIVAPAPDSTAGVPAAAAVPRMSFNAVNALSLTFDSSGGRPFTVWLDGLSFE